MNILKTIFGKRSSVPLDLLDMPPTDPTNRPKYWTRHNLDWVDVSAIHVRGDSVYLVRYESEEHIAIRSDNRTAHGYADAIGRAHCVPVFNIREEVEAA